MILGIYESYTFPMLSLWKTVARTSLAKSYGLLTGVVFLYLTARYLGPEGRGELVTVTTWAATFATFCYLSLDQVAIRDAAQSDGKEWFSDAFGALLFWAATTTLIGWLAAVALYGITGGAIFGDVDPRYIAAGLLALPFLIWHRYSTGLLIAMSRLDIHNRFLVAGRTIKLVLFLSLASFVDNVFWLALAAIILSDVFVATGGIRLFYKTAGHVALLEGARNIRVAKSGLTLHLNAVGTFLISASDILMLNYYRGAEETGFYQLGFQLTTMMMIIPQSANMVIFGKIASLGPDKAWITHHRKMLVQVLLLVVAGAIVVGLTAPWWLIWLAGEAFSPTLDILPWQLLSVVGMTFSTLMASQWIGRGYFWQASSLTFLVGSCNLAANSILIPAYGMHGAIWASLCVYSFSIVANGFMIWHCNTKAAEAIKNAAKV